jgi:hypothetical protein
LETAFAFTFLWDLLLVAKTGFAGNSSGWIFGIGFSGWVTLAAASGPYLSGGFFIFGDKVLALSPLFIDAEVAWY